MRLSKNKNQIIVSRHFMAGLFLFMVMLVSACGKTIDQAESYHKSGLTVTFKNLALITNTNEEQTGELDDLEIDHPVSLSTEMVTRHLNSLWYKNIDPPGKPLPVFTVQEVEELAPLFSVSLKKLDISHYLVFEYDSRNGMIAGEVFGTVDKLHWRLKQIHNVYYDDNLLSGRETWKLVRRLRGQKIRKIKTGVISLTRENWIINDLQLPHIKRNPNAEEAVREQVQAAPSPGSSAGRRQVNPELKRKLRSLKQLRDEGLIEENEYKQKKEELLNQFLKK